MWGIHLILMPETMLFQRRGGDASLSPNYIPKILPTLDPSLEFIPIENN